MATFEPTARVVLDSVSPLGVRLMTLEVTIHRFVLPELNTHRAFCVSGNAMIEFNLPAGSRGGRYARVFRMSIEEFANKWNSGASQRINKPRKVLPLHLVELSKIYQGAEIAKLLGISKSNIHTACRSGALTATKGDGRSDPWMILGSDFISYWNESGLNQQPIRERLSRMRIRQVNEDTGRIQTSTVKNVIVSGIKPVARITLASGEYIDTTVDHRILTNEGWRRAGDLSVGSMVAVEKFGKLDEDKLDPLRLKKIDGRWRSVWQRSKASEFRSSDPMCRSCRSEIATDVAHIIAVNRDTSIAFDGDNVTFLCQGCHKDMDRLQGWQGGTYLYAGYSEIVSIEDAGCVNTYDLEIDGEFPNFLASGIVVHNSRNSASSRAIPFKRLVEKVLAQDVVPLEWGSEKPGMQGGEPISDQNANTSKILWLAARKSAIETASNLVDLGVHKSIANRLIEPFAPHTVIVTATEWDGFWEQRISTLAQPEIRAAAIAMKAAYDASTPTLIEQYGWHTPYIQDDEADLSLELRMKISAARCARVSYLTHDGIRDIVKDEALFTRLVSAKPAHYSPLEHVATPVPFGGKHLGNLRGWNQLRHAYEL